MNIIKINSLLIVLYIYTSSISLLGSPFTSTFNIRVLLSILLVVAALLINKAAITLKVILIYSLLIFSICINLLVVPYKEYVLADGVIFILYSFLPIYLLTQSKVSFLYLKKYWLKISVIFTFLIPLYYILRQNGFISYYDLGFLAHLNILIITYHLLSRKNDKIRLIIYFIINVSVLAILGSRMVLVASLLTILFTYILLSNKKSISFYFNLGILGIIVYIINKNLIEILLLINNAIIGLGIKSRNLSMFITQLTGRNDNSMILSGRDEIYPVIYQYLLEYGFFPSGFGITRFLTNGSYYHSHNFILEILLTFGLIGGVGILILFVTKIRILAEYKDLKDRKIMFDFLIIFLISFFIRSLTGTYFVTDSIFLVSMGIILSINRRKFQHT